MELKDFLVAARKNTWASGGGKKPAVRKGSEGCFVYEAEGWRYEDEYFGAERFQGQEVVYKEGQPVWGMVYNGGVPEGAEVDSKAEFAFLKQALVTFVDRARFPGKVKFEKDKRAYICDFVGSLDLFLGRELIKLEGKPTHEVFFTGGKIAKKEE